ncbi:MAG: hypothetical protein SV487_01645 [Thermodesulfobacteriota bacterium]|nr:hypothetical protein [Thermodesulfobacteriota bacterium]
MDLELKIVSVNNINEPEGPRGITDFSPWPQIAKKQLLGQALTGAEIRPGFHNHFRKRPTKIRRRILSQPGFLPISEHLPEKKMFPANLNVV